MTSHCRSSLSCSKLLDNSFSHVRDVIKTRMPTRPWQVQQLVAQLYDLCIAIWVSVMIISAPRYSERQGLGKPSSQLPNYIISALTISSQLPNYMISVLTIGSLYCSSVSASYQQRDGVEQYATSLVTRLKRESQFWSFYISYYDSSQKSFSHKHNNCIIHQPAANCSSF